MGISTGGEDVGTEEEGGSSPLQVEEPDFTDAPDGMRELWQGIEEPKRKLLMEHWPSATKKSRVVSLAPGEADSNAEQVASAVQSLAGAFSHAVGKHAGAKQGG